jgi:hypothetical protein
LELGNLPREGEGGSNVPDIPNPDIPDPTPDNPDPITRGVSKPTITGDLRGEDLTASISLELGSLPREGEGGNKDPDIRGDSGLTIAGDLRGEDLTASISLELGSLPREGEGGRVPSVDKDRSVPTLGEAAKPTNPEETGRGD